MPTSGYVSQVDNRNKSTGPPSLKQQLISIGGTMHKNKVKKVMGEFKRGTLKSSSGKKVKSRKQAVAIALSEARRGKR
jgi:hypothetical protein